MKTAANSIRSSNTWAMDEGEEERRKKPTKNSQRKELRENKKYNKSRTTILYTQHSIKWNRWWKTTHTHTHHNNTELTVNVSAISFIFPLYSIWTWVCVCVNVFDIKIFFSFFSFSSSYFLWILTFDGGKQISFVSRFFSYFLFVIVNK